jgi:hypothetical protein
LYHKETLNASFNASFLQAVLGYPITPEDLESYDPELYKNKVVYMRSLDDSALAVLDEYFVSSTARPMLYEEGVVPSVLETELKAGGSEIQVTAANLEEYLHLFTKYRIVGAIQEQIEWFREGLSSYLTQAILKNMRTSFTIAEFQLALCGTPTIDVDDWQQHSRCTGGFTCESNCVVWFWDIVRDMHGDDASAVLQFCKWTRDCIIFSLYIHIYT